MEQEKIWEFPHVGIIGGGFGGICAAIQLEKQFGRQNYTILEQNEDFGGTWLVNKYPGCACDVQSHLYSFSFEPNPYWTKNYSDQPEILDYIQGIAVKYKLHKRAKFETQVRIVEWDEGKCQWNITTFDKKLKSIEILSFDFIFIAVGALRVPYIPPEFQKFKGTLIHSAEWKDDIDLTEKVVGVIGSGASAIQIIPMIASKVKQLHSYQRKPAWVIPRSQFQFPDVIKNLFKIMPILMWLFRCLIFLFNEFNHGAFKDKTILNYFGSQISKFYLRNQIPDEELRSKLSPNYQFGCKRVLVSENYFATFNSPKVFLHTEAICKIEEDRLKTADGKSVTIDILILATGYQTQDFLAPLKVIGRDKNDVIERWRLNGPQTYYGIMSHNLPNLFILFGPNTALGHSSVIFLIECQVNFGLDLIRETLKRRMKVVRLKETVQIEWMNQMKNDMKCTIWATHQCGSWYSDQNGNITCLWPKNCISYYRETKQINFNCMEFI